MSARVGMAKLNRSQKDLLARWDHTQTHWKDEVSRRIEQKTLEPLAADVWQVVAAMAQIAAVLQQVRRDCD